MLNDRRTHAGRNQVFSQDLASIEKAGGAARNRPPRRPRDAHGSSTSARSAASGIDVVLNRDALARYGMQIEGP